MGYFNISIARKKEHQGFPPVERRIGLADFKRRVELGRAKSFSREEAVAESRRWPAALRIAMIPHGEGYVLTSGEYVLREEGAFK